MLLHENAESFFRNLLSLPGVAMAWGFRLFGNATWGAIHPQGGDGGILGSLHVLGDGVEDGLGNSSLLLELNFGMRFWFLDVGYLGWIQ